MRVSAGLLSSQQLLQLRLQRRKCPSTMPQLNLLAVRHFGEAEARFRYEEHRVVAEAASSTTSPAGFARARPAVKQAPWPAGSWAPASFSSRSSRVLQELPLSA